MVQSLAALTASYPWLSALGLPVLKLNPSERRYLKAVTSKLTKKLGLNRGVRISIRKRSDLGKLKMIEEAIARSSGSRELIAHSFNRRDPLEETAALAYVYDDVMLSSNSSPMSQYGTATRWIERMMLAVYGADNKSGLTLFANIPARDRERAARMIRLDHTLKNHYLPSNAALVDLLFNSSEEDYASYVDFIARHDTTDAAQLQFLKEGGSTVLADGAL
jgi:hypothetical protein